MRTGVVWPSGESIARSEQLIRESEAISIASQALRDESNRLRKIGRELKRRREPDGASPLKPK